MSSVECPYCFEIYDYDSDTEGFYQDSLQEFDCPECGKSFMAVVYWDLVITSERKTPCLNGEEHKYEAVVRQPILSSKDEIDVSCKYCERTAQVPVGEATEYGYTQERVDEGLKQWEEYFGKGRNQKGI